MIFELLPPILFIRIYKFRKNEENIIKSQTPSCLPKQLISNFLILKYHKNKTSKEQKAWLILSNSDKIYSKHWLALSEIKDIP